VLGGRALLGCGDALIVADPLALGIGLDAPAPGGIIFYAVGLADTEMKEQSTRVGGSPQTNTIWN